jgi:N12 class adenine-specific DNA methylase
MNTFQIQIVSSILTLLFSGLISAMVTHRLASSRAERDFRRQRVEQLYLHVQRYIKKLGGIHVVTEQLMAGLITLDQANSVLLEAAESNEDLENIEMLVNIYFRKLIPTYTELNNAVLEWKLTRDQFVWKEGRKDLELDADFLKRHAGDMGNIRSARDDFNEELFGESKRFS